MFILVTVCTSAIVCIALTNRHDVEGANKTPSVPTRSATIPKARSKYPTFAPKLSSTIPAPEEHSSQESSSRRRGGRFTSLASLLKSPPEGSRERSVSAPVKFPATDTTARSGQKPQSRYERLGRAPCAPVDQPEEIDRRSCLMRRMVADFLAENSRRRAVG